MTGDSRPRLPLIALGCAVLAVVVSVVAAVIVLTRGDERPVAAAPAAVPALLDRRVAAADVMKLPVEIEIVIDAGLPRGVRVSDPALAPALGLREDDVIIAISGRAMKSQSDVSGVTNHAASTGVTMMYVELDRGSARTLVRWQIDGNLMDARRDQILARSGGSAAASGPGPGPGSAGSAGGSSLDPFVDEIVKLDDTHSRVSRATLEGLLTNATALSRGCRIVPAVKNGKPDGYKLYAVRPSSVFARLGFVNGDTVHSINGAPLADVDDLVSLLVDAKRKVPAFVFDLTRRGQPVTIHVEITR